MENIIRVDFANRTHAPKPINGVNNGPICNQGIVNLSKHYRKMHIPTVRLHDTDGSNSRFYVDVTRIFPNFDADENDEKNYFFAPTDKLLKSIKALDADIVYRLGESIDHDFEAGWFARPPKDFAKWARICVNIIRHYNEGWADGLNLGVQYWEIWNEGEGINEHGLRCNWRDGTVEQLFDLYRTASCAIKNYDPSLKVGGMAFCNFNDPARQFISFCKENSLPLDFFSFHGYDNHVEDIDRNSGAVRATLDENGFTDTKIVYDEWNYIGFERDVPGNVWMNIRNDETPELCEEVHLNQGNEVGGSFVAGALAVMNSCPIDIAHYYDGQVASNWCGLFNSYAIPLKPYYSFIAYGDIYANAESLVEVDCPLSNRYALAGVGKDFKAVMISSFRGDEEHFGVHMANLGEGRKKAEIYITDKDNNMLLDRVEYFVGDEVCQTLKLKKYAVAYIKIYNEA